MSLAVRIASNSAWLYVVLPKLALKVRTWEGLHERHGAEIRVPYLTGRVERSCSQATSTLRGLGVSVVPSKIRLWHFIGGKVRGSFHLRISA